MEDNSKQCYRCEELNRYYTKGEKQLNKTDCGWCWTAKGIVNIHHSCEHFRPKIKSKRTPLRLQECLNNLFLQISAIRELMESQSNDSEDV